LFKILLNLFLFLKEKRLFLPQIGENYDDSIDPRPPFLPHPPQKNHFTKCQWVAQKALLVIWPAASTEWKIVQL
jgi:hypothetical protein